jgi:hypothetical protein
MNKTLSLVRKQEKLPEVTIEKTVGCGLAVLHQVNVGSEVQGTKSTIWL